MVPTYRLIVCWPKAKMALIGEFWRFLVSDQRVLSDEIDSD